MIKKKNVKKKEKLKDPDIAAPPPVPNAIIYLPPRYTNFLYNMRKSLGVLLCGGLSITTIANITGINQFIDFRACSSVLPR